MLKRRLSFFWSHRAFRLIRIYVERSLRFQGPRSRNDQVDIWPFRLFPFAGKFVEMKKQHRDVERWKAIRKWIIRWIGDEVTFDQTLAGRGRGKRKKKQNKEETRDTRRWPVSLGGYGTRSSRRNSRCLTIENNGKRGKVRDHHRVYYETEKERQTDKMRWVYFRFRDEPRRAAPGCACLSRTD